MPLFYMDASALMRWAEGQSVSPTPEQACAAREIEDIVEEALNTVAVSEMTFIEFHDNVLRYRSTSRQEWTDEWVTAVQTQLMMWIESGRVLVQQPAQRELDVAISYITMARDAGRSLKAKDAIHLNRAVEWAHEASEQVTLVTGDEAFAKFLVAFPAAATFVTLREVVVTQEPIPGT